MDFNWREDDNDNDENDDEETAVSGYEALRDGLIFLIDAGKSMHKRSGKLDSPFQMCLRAALSTLTNRIISKDRDVISVVLFGTEKEKNSMDLKNIFILQDLNQPGAERILEIEKLLNKRNDEFEFGSSNAQCSISDALWTCASLFTNCTLKLGERKILLFTNEDNPHSTNAQLQRQAKEKAKDLNELGIVVDLIHMKKDDHEFKVDLFYRDIVFFGDEVKTLPNPSERFEHLLKRVRAKSHRKRAAGRFNFHLGEGIKMGVGVYSLIRQANRPLAIKLNKKDNAELKTIRKMFLDQTGEILLQVDTKKFQTYAGKRIYMENDEVEQLKSFGDNGLELLGFKPSSVLKPHLNIRPSLFLYPDETSVSGSTTLFSALLKSCLKKEQIPICRFIPRRNVIPKIVMLVPQEEEKDERGGQSVPPGFHVVFQPFADDIRKLKLDNRQDPPVELTEKAKEIVKKLQFVYEPENFENPALQTHWRNIEALALNRDEPDEVIDHTLPDESKINNKAGPLLKDFNEMAFVSQADAANKRKKSAEPVGSAKRAKPEVGGNDQVDVMKAAEQGKLGSLTVTVLRQFCKSKAIKCGSKKADIIDAINDFMGD